MKKVFCILLSILICSVCLAQSLFSTFILNGDVKMREQFYDMALSYYNKAKSVASNQSETALAETKIAECEKVIKSLEEAIASTPVQKSRVIFSDQYLETGDIYSFENDAIILADEDADISLYYIEVRTDCVLILSHSDSASDEQLDDVPAGLVIPLISETKDLRRFASENDGEEFIVYKKPIHNDYGDYYVVLRKKSNRYLRLYSSAEFRQMMKETQEIKVEPEQVSDSSLPGNTDFKLLPITFSESWVLNLDSDGIRLGDSRDEPLVASDIRWLTLRIRYSCPDNYENPVRFDIKIVNPRGELVTVTGKGVAKGYSTYEILEALPGGGIFNIAYGADEPGLFIPGKYVVGIWNNDVQYYSVIIDLK